MNKRRLILGITGAVVARGCSSRAPSWRPTSATAASRARRNDGVPGYRLSRRVHRMQLDPAGPSPAPTLTGSATIWTAADGTKSIDLNGFGPGAHRADHRDDGRQHVLSCSASSIGQEQFPNGDASPSIKTLTVERHGDRREPYRFDTAATANRQHGLGADGLLVQGQAPHDRAPSPARPPGAFGPAIDSVVVTEDRP